MVAKVSVDRYSQGGSFIFILMDDELELRAFEPPSEVNRNLDVALQLLKGQLPEFEIVSWPELLKALRLRARLRSHFRNKRA
jgi:hypothetical protein